MEVIFQAWQWVPWLMGFGAVGWVALAIFAPSVLLIITPALQGIMQGLVEFIKVLYAGVVNILSSWQSVVAVGLIALMAVNYGAMKQKQRQEVAPLVQQAPEDTAPTRAVPSKKKSFIPLPPSTPAPRFSLPSIEGIFRGDSR